MTFPPQEIFLRFTSRVARLPAPEFDGWRSGVRANVDANLNIQQVLRHNMDRPGVTSCPCSAISAATAASLRTEPASTRNMETYIQRVLSARKTMENVSYVNTHAGDGTRKNAADGMRLATHFAYNPPLAMRKSVKHTHLIILGGAMLAFAGCPESAVAASAAPYSGRFIPQQAQPSSVRIDGGLFHSLPLARPDTGTIRLIPNAKAAASPSRLARQPNLPRTQNDVPARRKSDGIGTPGDL